MTAPAGRHFLDASLPTEAAPSISMNFDDISAVLLDCDGTLVPAAEEVHEECVRQTMREFFGKADIPYTNETEDRFKRIWTEGLGKGITNFYVAFEQSCTPQHQAKLSSVISDPLVFEGAYEHRYVTSDLSALVQVRAGMEKFIDEAKAAGVPVAIVSNAKQKVLEATIRAAGLTHKVDLILGKDSVEALGFKAKPDGGSYLCAAELLSSNGGKEIDLGRSVGAEDTKTGLDSLRDAGVGQIIWCNNGTEKHSFMEEPPVPVTVITFVNGDFYDDYRATVSGDAAVEKPAFVADTAHDMRRHLQ